MRIGFRQTSFLRPIQLVLICIGTFPASPAQSQDAASHSDRDVASGTKSLIENLRLPVYENELTEPPDWLGEDVPFDVAEYIGPPESRIAARHYFDAFFEFDHFLWDCIPELRVAIERAEDKAEGGGTAVLESDARYVAARLRKKWLYAFLDRVDWEYTNICAEHFDEMTALMEEYETAFDKIEKAQQFESCVFPSTLDGLSGQHTFAARHAARVLTFDSYLRIHQKDFDKAIDRFAAILQLKPDVQRRGDLTSQLAALAPERLAFELLAEPLLSYDGLTIEHCDRIIRILKAHEERLSTDPIVESDRYSYLLLRNIFQLLEKDEYATSERADYLGLDDDIVIDGMLLQRELVDLNLYNLNSDEIGKLVGEMADQIPEIAEALKRLPHDPETKTEMDRMLANLFAWQHLSLMTADDYRRETEVLNVRHRQIMAAAGQPYPQRIDEIAKLEANWTTDESWKLTKILRLLKPHDIAAVAKAYQRENLRRSAFLGQVAFARWRLENVQDPPSLEAIMQAAGIESAPVDPYSGLPLRMTTIDGEMVVYSFGPDGDDDQGQKAMKFRSVIYSNSKDGDFVFSLN